MRGEFNKSIDNNVDVIGHDGICSDMQEHNQRKASVFPCNLERVGMLRN